MPLFSALAISPFYALVSWSSYSCVSHKDEEIDAASIVGVLVVLIGECGCALHHYLLRQLRRGEEDKSYKIPRGGLFAYAVCPHYFFELIAWCGFAGITAHPIHQVVAVGMASYLHDRARQQAKWNESHIKGYPKKLSYLIPWPSFESRPYKSKEEWKEEREKAAEKAKRAERRKRRRKGKAV